MLRPSHRQSEAPGVLELFRTLAEKSPAELTLLALMRPALCEKAEDDPANIAWTRKAWEDMKCFSTGGNYVNFLTEDETPERVAAALGKGMGRLAEVKAKWDPKNMFRTNRNIKPG